MRMADALRIPNRFESLQEQFPDGYRPLILPVESDLRALSRLREQAVVQTGGVLCFLLGPTGIGKTTTVYSAAANMPQTFAPVVVVPPAVKLRDAAGWLNQGVPLPKGEQATLVLFDGREVSDDDVGLQQFISGLNQILRRRRDVLFIWPTTDEQWHQKVARIASRVGGTNLVPPGSDHTVLGPEKKEWAAALDRILLQFDKGIADLGLANDFIQQAVARAPTIGAFLSEIGGVVAERVVKLREIKRLPQLTFVVTSSGDVSGEANRLRRAGTQSLAAEPLLAYSPRSEAGKWWAARNQNPNHHLGYIISLFDARLVTMSASAVVYACLHHGEEDLLRLAQDAGARPDKGNAGRTIQASELFRYFRGEAVPEFTTGRKGKVLDATVRAYAQIQAVSLKRHKAINQAICELVATHPETTPLTEKRFEVAFGGDVVTDAVLRLAGREYHLEFHHLSSPKCRAATMASYVMDKLRGYAWHHQLIPR